jgi:hypothetical protein
VFSASSRGRVCCSSHGFVARTPKLAITANGLQVRGWITGRVLSPDEITLIRITVFRRLAAAAAAGDRHGRRPALRVHPVGSGHRPVAVSDALTAAGYTR